MYQWWEAVVSGENRSLAGGHRKCCHLLFWFVFFFPPCGYVFSQLSNNLLKFCPLTSSGFRRIPHPHLPCFPALPFSISQWMSPIFSPPLHKFGSTKEKKHGCVSDSARSYHFITLWTASFPCAISVWSLSQLRF